MKYKADLKRYYRDIKIKDPDMIYIRDFEDLDFSIEREEKEIFRNILIYMFIAEVLANVVVYQRDYYFEDLRVVEPNKIYGEGVEVNDKHF